MTGTKNKMIGLAVCAVMAGGALCAVRAQTESRPRVLIIGDSISLGYTPFVKAALSNRMEIVHAPGNNQATATGLAHLETWLGTGKWDVIHFNWGLHDLKYIDDQGKATDVAKGRQWVPVEQYETNLGTLVRRLKTTGARLIWCSTTPVPEGTAIRIAGSEVAYNEAALRVMRGAGVPVNDLHAFVGPPERRLAMGGRPRDVHYTAAGSKALAGEVVRAIETALESRAGQDGWVELFDGKSLAGWRPYGKPVGTAPGEGWSVEGGLLRKKPKIRGGDLITEKMYGDFELEWEWRISPGGNNGVKYCVTEARPGAPGYEYQMIDDLSAKWVKLPANARTASFYAVLPPAADKPLKPAGEWNVSRIVVRGDRCEHSLNGRKVLEYVFGSAEVKAGVAASKFAEVPDFGDKIKGHIMLTDHTDETWFRSIRIREPAAQP